MACSRMRLAAAPSSRWESTWRSLSSDAYARAVRLRLPADLNSGRAPIRSDGPFRRLPGNGVIDPGDAPLDFDFSLREDDGRTLFLPQRARQVRSAAQPLYRSKTGIVIAKDPQRQYGVEAAIPITRPADIRRLRWAPADASWFAVPPTLRAGLLQHLPSGGYGSVPQAVAATRHFFVSNRFRYTLQLPKSLPKDRDPVLAFLDRREGHCELYATTACFFLRLMGVPARLAGGVRCSERIGRGIYRARFSDSHTWVEIPCREVGLVAFDFTPPDSRAADMQGPSLAHLSPVEVADQADEPESAAGLLDWDHPFRYGRTEQERLIGWVGRSIDATPLLYLFAVVAVVMVSHGCWRAWRDRPPDPLVPRPPPGGSRRTLAFYARWLRRCSSHGYRRRPAQTPREFLRSLPKELRRGGGRITWEFERIRYGEQEREG